MVILIFTVINSFLTLITAPLAGGSGMGASTKDPVETSVHWNIVFIVDYFHALIKIISQRVDI